MAFKPIFFLKKYHDFWEFLPFFGHQPSHLNIPVVLHVVRPHLLAERVELPPLRGLQQLRGVRDPAGTAVHGDQPGGWIFAGKNGGKMMGKMRIFPDPKQKMLGKMMGESTMRGENDDEHDGKMMGET